MSLLAVAILSTAISIYYYLKIPFRMYLKKALTNEIKGQEKGWESWVFILLACGILLCFLAPNLVFNV
jgi:NADH:ubiquinone oxidoreductase subunit 2 (subunit N)